MHGPMNVKLGRPLTRLLDEAETGTLRPNWWEMMMIKLSVIIILCMQQMGFFHLQTPKMEAVCSPTMTENTIFNQLQD